MNGLRKASRVCTKYPGSRLSRVCTIGIEALFAGQCVKLLRKPSAWTLAQKIQPTCKHAGCQQIQVDPGHYIQTHTRVYTYYYNHITSRGDINGWSAVWRAFYGTPTTLVATPLFPGLRRAQTLATPIDRCLDILEQQQQWRQPWQQQWQQHLINALITYYKETRSRCGVRYLPPHRLERERESARRPTTTPTAAKHAPFQLAPPLFSRHSLHHNTYTGHITIQQSLSMCLSIYISLSLLDLSTKHLYIIYLNC